MNIYEELSKVRGHGLNMLAVLKQAANSGHSQTEAIDALDKLFEEACAEGKEEEADIVVQVRDVANNFCRPEMRIWD